jgi:hypothetical protein
MFDTTTNITINCNTDQHGNRKADPWTKVIAVTGVVSMMLTALLVALAIMALQRPTLVVRRVTIPAPVLIHNHHHAPTNHRAVPQRAINSRR